MKKILGLFLVIVFTASVAIAADRPVYTVQAGDCLIKVAVRAGEVEPAYMILVRLNPDLFPDLQPYPPLFHPSHNHLRVGQQLVVPAEWVDKLGFITISPRPPRPPAIPIEEKNSIPWGWWLAALIIALALINYLLNRQGVSNYLRRLTREVGFLFFPLRMDPMLRAYHEERSIRAWAADCLGRDVRPRPEDLDFIRISGEFLITHRRPDGSRYSRLSSVRNEPVYRMHQGDEDQVVFAGCGNPAIRISSHPRSLTGRLKDAARHTFRPVGEGKEVVLQPPAPTPVAAPEVIGPPNRQIVQYFQNGRWRNVWRYRP